MACARLGTASSVIAADFLLRVIAVVLAAGNLSGRTAARWFNAVVSLITARSARLTARLSRRVIATLGSAAYVWLVAAAGRRAVLTRSAAPFTGRAFV